MLAPHALFSFGRLSDPTKHREYNEWHQLDHRPENLALPGVAWGDRWVRSPDCARDGDVGQEPYTATQYTNMYWLRAPVDETIRQFVDLGERCRQWGRRPDLAYVQRDLTGFFTVVAVLATRRTSVTSAAVPIRPARGVHVSLIRIRLPDSPPTDELFRWYDRIRMPALLKVPGVAGAAIFASAPGTSRGEVRAAPQDLRLHLLYLDDDPVAVGNRIGRTEADWRTAGRDIDRSELEEVLFAGRLRAITPWYWDWFGESARPR